MVSRFQSVLIAAALVVAPLATQAGPQEHDLVRRGVEHGELRPLAEILQQVRDRLPGKIIRTEIEQKHGRWLYEFRVVDGQGRLFEVYVDARTGEIGRIKEK
jgi:uncharacterized membrane protein YkoI